LDPAASSLSIRVLISPAQRQGAVSSTGLWATSGRLSSVVSPSRGTLDLHRRWSLLVGGRRQGGMTLYRALARVVRCRMELLRCVSFLGEVERGTTMCSAARTPKMLRRGSGPCLGTCAGAGPPRAPNPEPRNLKYSRRRRVLSVQHTTPRLSNVFCFWHGRGRKTPLGQRKRLIEAGEMFGAAMLAASGRGGLQSSNTYVASEPSEILAIDRCACIRYPLIILV